MRRSERRARKRATTAVAFAVLACLLGAAGCAGGTAAADEIEIGALLPLSGKQAASGKSNLAGMRLVVKAVNDAGGIRSLGGKKLKLVTADDASDPMKAAEQARQLIQRREVPFILGPYSTPEAQAAVPVSERAKVGLLSTQASYDEFFEGDYEYVTTVSMTSSQFGDSYAGFVRWLNSTRRAGIKKITITYPDNDYGQTAAKSAARELRRMGVQVTGSLSFPPDTKDLTPIVQRTRNAAPDAVVSIGYLEDGLQLHRSRVTQNYTSPPLWIGGSASFTDDRLWKLLGSAARPALSGDTYGLAQFERTVRTPGVRWLVQHFKGPGPLDQAVAAGAQAAWILVTALERSATTDRAKLAAAVHRVTLPPDSERVSMPQFARGVAFEPTGKPKAPQALFVHWANGGKQVVYPDEFADAKARPGGAGS
ncbi:ABC transporter substrate-binding protein [Actinomadura sp. 1N219]|uniref:ABC transporter substrate-binding protein n=1 Tax=Actinomadura sp. 1N219 TaxID=3375152 RepID=UPI0037AB33A2